MVIQQPNDKRREVSLEEAARLVGVTAFLSLANHAAVMKRTLLTQPKPMNLHSNRCSKAAGCSHYLLICFF
jgi:hypothetical protein